VALLDLLDDALAAGWTHRAACSELELGELRAWRWQHRRAAGALGDRAPGGSPMHALLDDEVAEIVALYHEWGEIDRSHRKLAYRGSYLERVWVSPSSVRRVLADHGLHLHPLPRPGRSVRTPFPDWVDYRPNSIWIYDTTHFTRAKVAVTVIEDLVSRKWIADIVSAEETSTQVEIVFTDALAVEGLLALVEARADGRVDPTVDDEHRPILLAVSDNGPQMTSGSTREFMALMAIAQHFGRPGTPTDQAWIESLFGHVKAEWPHLLTTPDPVVLRAELAVIRQHYNGTRLHAGIGYVTPQRRARGPRASDPQGPGSRPRSRPSPTPHLPSAATPAPTRPGTRRCWLIQPGSLSRSRKQVSADSPTADKAPRRHGVTPHYHRAPDLADPDRNLAPSRTDHPTPGREALTKAAIRRPSTIWPEAPESVIWTC
jgi:putative transposase